MLPPPLVPEDHMQTPTISIIIGILAVGLTGLAAIYAAFRILTLAGGMLP